MPTLNLKHTHKPVNDYYAALDHLAQFGVTHETAVRSAFNSLLERCTRQARLTRVLEHAVNPLCIRRVVVQEQE